MVDGFPVGFRDEVETQRFESVVVAALASFVAALIPFAIADGIFQFASSGVPFWRQVIWPGVFPGNGATFWISFLCGWTAIDSRRVAVPYLIGLVLVLILLPVHASSGSATQVELSPQMGRLQYNLLVAAFGMNGILVWVWICLQASGVARLGPSPKRADRSD
jgi:hypothetical protein